MILVLVIAKLKAHLSGHVQLQDVPCFPLGLVLGIDQAQALFLALELLFASVKGPLVEVWRAYARSVHVLLGSISISATYIAVSGATLAFAFMWMSASIL